LTGLVDSSKCPECGQPIVEVLTRGPMWRTGGKRYRSETTVFGLPVIHIALGPKDDEPRGKAKGIIAIGDMATGFLAIGGLARGGIAIGGLALGLVSFGGLAIGLLAAIGGGAVGGLASGGGCVGIVASGGGAVGVIADGGGAYGWFARGGDPAGTHTINWQGPSSPRATEIEQRWAWLIGKKAPGNLTLCLWILAMFGLTAAILAVIALLGHVAGSASPSQHEEYR
jgi:hypothetical protein